MIRPYQSAASGNIMSAGSPIRCNVHVGVESKVVTYFAPGIPSIQFHTRVKGSLNKFPPLSLLMLSLPGRSLFGLVVSVPGLEMFPSCVVWLMNWDDPSGFS